MTQRTSLRLTVCLMASASAMLAPAATAAATPCGGADALASAGESSPAKAVYSRLLLKNPQQACATQGLEALNKKSWSTNVRDWLGQVTAILALAALGFTIAFAAVGALFAALTYLRPVRNWMRRRRILRKLFRPRLAISIFDDGGAPAALGGGVTVLIREQLAELSGQQDADPNYTLDRLTATEDVAAVVGKLGDVAPQFKSLSAVLTVIPQLARLPRYTLNGALQAAGQMGGGITAILDEQHAASEGSTLWSRASTTDAGTYHALAAGTAGWADYTIRGREQVPVTRFTGSADSFGHLRSGLQLEEDGRLGEARTAYVSAVRADATNVAALLNLAVLDARGNRFTDAIGWLWVARDVLEQGEG